MDYNREGIKMELNLGVLFNCAVVGSGAVITIAHAYRGLKDACDRTIDGIFDFGAMMLDQIGRPHP
jgi:hypothetical protein